MRVRAERGYIVVWSLAYLIMDSEHATMCHRQSGGLGRQAVFNSIWYQRFDIHCTGDSQGRSDPVGWVRVQRSRTWTVKSVGRRRWVPQSGDALYQWFLIRRIKTTWGWSHIRHPAYQIFTLQIIKQQNYSYDIAIKIILWLEDTTTWRTVWKDCSMRKVESHCSIWFFNGMDGAAHPAEGGSSWLRLLMKTPMPSGNAIMEIPGSHVVSAFWASHKHNSLDLWQTIPGGDCSYLAYRSHPLSRV